MPTWIESLKEWNAGQKSWCIPRKGSAAYLEVRALMEGKPLPKKATTDPETEKLISGLYGSWVSYARDYLKSPTTEAYLRLEAASRLPRTTNVSQEHVGRVKKNVARILAIHPPSKEVLSQSTAIKKAKKKSDVSESKKMRASVKPSTTDEMLEIFVTRAREADASEREDAMDAVSAYLKKTDPTLSWSEADAKAESLVSRKTGKGRRIAEEWGFE